MKKFITPLLFFAFFTAAFGQTKKEITLYLKNGVLLNANDMSSSNTIAKASNTFQQNLGISYTKVTKQNILLSAGMEIGYEQYRTTIDFPFYAYGFQNPAKKGPQYQRNGFIPNAQVHINIGYRFKGSAKIQPEVRLGQIIQMPLNYVILDKISVEQTLANTEEPNFEMNGFYGMTDFNFRMNPLNYIYVGVGLPGTEKEFKKINLGIQLQSLILRSQGASYFRIQHYDAMHRKRADETFNSSHTSVSLVLGVML